MSSRDKAILPFPTEFIIPFPPATQRDVITARVQKELSNLAAQWKYDAQTSSGVCFAVDNVWSRSARRKRRKLDHDGAESMENESSGKKVKTDEHGGTTAQVHGPTQASTSTLIQNTSPVQWSPENPDADSRGSVGDAAKDNDDDTRTAAKLGVRITIEAECVRIDWLKGRDSVLWESFCGMLKRAVDTVAHGGGSGGGPMVEGNSQHV